MVRFEPSFLKFYKKLSFRRNKPPNPTRMTEFLSDSAKVAGSGTSLALADSLRTPNKLY